MKKKLRKYLAQASAPNRKRCAPWAKILASIILGLLCLATFLWNYFSETKEHITCFYEQGNQLPELADEECEPGKSIFFHETSCSLSCSDIPLNTRQACSVESAVLAHPEKDVFLLVTAPVAISLAQTKNILVRELMTYWNFKVRHTPFSKYLSDTPLAKIDESGALNGSKWPVSHSSDILRYATLYKFGGIYLDLDVIVLKSLSNLINFAGAESNNSIGSSVLGFGTDKIGREVAQECAAELTSTYKSDDWGYNGPGVITRVLQKRCRAVDVPHMLKSNCRGFEIKPPESFYAIPFSDAKLFFEEGQENHIDGLLKNSYAVHLWNKVSSKFALNSESRVPFSKYAKKYCPKIYRAVNGVF